MRASLLVLVLLLLLPSAASARGGRYVKHIQRSSHPGKRHPKQRIRVYRHKPKHRRGF